MRKGNPFTEKLRIEYAAMKKKSDQETFDVEETDYYLHDEEDVGTDYDLQAELERRFNELFGFLESDDN